jgi:hypothetical protein
MCVPLRCLKMLLTAGSVGLIGINFGASQESATILVEISKLKCVIDNIPSYRSLGVFPQIIYFDDCPPDYTLRPYRAGQNYIDAYTYDQGHNRAVASLPGELYDSTQGPSGEPAKFIIVSEMELECLAKIILPDKQETFRLKRNICQ